jgi:hypothetical protein
MIGVLPAVFVPVLVLVPLFVFVLLLAVLLEPPSPPPPPHAARLAARESATITPNADFRHLIRIFFFSTTGSVP